MTGLLTAPSAFGCRSVVVFNHLPFCIIHKTIIFLFVEAISSLAQPFLSNIAVVDSAVYKEWDKWRNTERIMTLHFIHYLYPLTLFLILLLCPHKQKLQLCLEMHSLCDSDLALCTGHSQIKPYLIWFTHRISSQLIKIPLSQRTR